MKRAMAFATVVELVEKVDKLLDGNAVRRKSEIF